MDDSPMPFGENQDTNLIQDVEMEDGRSSKPCFAFLSKIYVSFFFLSYLFFF